MFTLTQNAERWFHFPFCKRDEIWKEAYSTPPSIRHTYYPESRAIEENGFEHRLVLWSTQSHLCAWGGQERRAQYYNFLFKLIISCAHHIGKKTHLSTVWTLSALNSNKTRTSILLSFPKCLAELLYVRRGLKQSLFEEAWHCAPNWSLSLCLIKRTSCVWAFINSAERDTVRGQTIPAETATRDGA